MVCGLWLVYRPACAGDRCLGSDREVAQQDKTRQERTGAGTRGQERTGEDANAVPCVLIIGIRITVSVSVSVSVVYILYIPYELE